MNIQFEQNHVNTIQTKEDNFVMPHTKAHMSKQANEESSIKRGADISGFVKDQTAYDGHGKTTDDIKNEFDVKDISSLQDYMTVMSNTLSEEDYQKLSEDGFHPASMNVEDTVTVLDEIKAKMAQAGVVVAGYNDDLDAETLTEITGSAVYAQTILDTFSNYGVEPTAENVKETVQQIEQMSEVDALSDSAIKYIVTNQLDLSFSELYKATYSAGATATAGATVEMSSEILGQIDRVIEGAGLTISEQTREEAIFMIQNEIPLIEENLEKVDILKNQSFPFDAKEVADASARAILEGKRPAQANAFISELLYEKAAKLYEDTISISDQAIEKAVSDNNTVNIRKLAEVSKAVDANMVVTAEEMSYSAVSAKRQLEEIRLQMTISANYQLLKKGMQIDIMPLKEVVEILKEQERETAAKLFPEKEPETQVESYKQWQQSNAIYSALPSMPARVIAEIDLQKTEILAVYEKGEQYASSFAKLQERYETVGTQVRADLGDSIKQAFRNIDEVLENAGMENTEENQRAVRILSYNQMEVTAEEINRVKEADFQLQDLIRQMTPAKTLQMLRDGVNPLHQDIASLQEYLNKAGEPLEELTAQAESYSKLIYQLEKNKEITSDEKDAMIGVYRLIRQVEKMDGAALGAVVNNELELNFSNLLKAVRTRKAGGFERAVSDEVGQIKVPAGLENSISEQIDKFFDQYSDEKKESAYREEAYRILKESVQVPEEIVEELSVHQIEITPDNMFARNQLSDPKENVFSKMRKHDLQEKTKNAAEKFVESFDDLEKAQEAYDTVISETKEVIESAMEESDASYLDIRSMVVNCKQLSIASSLAKDEMYMVPLTLEGEYTAVSIQIHHKKEANGAVEISFESENYGNVYSRFSIQDERVSGFLSSDKEDAIAKLEGKNEIIIANILKESGKNADVVYMKRSQVSPVRLENSQDNVATKELYKIAKGILKAFAE